MSTGRQPTLDLDLSLLPAGLRLAVGLSGGADSVALLCLLAERRSELGVVLHAAHLHHGLRGEEAEADLDFCRSLAERLNVEFHSSRADTGAEARADRTVGKPAETIEEAARRLRYGWFRRLMAEGFVDAVATAHTRDDQAETVLGKILRGAWTEGLSGIHPVVVHAEGRIVRPFLRVARAEIVEYLNRIGQPWREDSSNRQLTFTRNRIRHELLPAMEIWNPKLRDHLCQMAELARDEEAWWQTETDRLAAQILLPGRPVRGGGRAAAGGVALEVARLAGLPVAQQRRLLRRAAAGLGAMLDFEATETLRTLALEGRAGQKAELANLLGERTHRELQLSVGKSTHLAESPTQKTRNTVGKEYSLQVPGITDAAGFGVHVDISVSPGSQDRNGQGEECTMRAWKAGDRVLLRHSSGPKKVKEILERMHISGSERAAWPVIVCGGKVLWMKGVNVEPSDGIRIVVNEFPAPEA